MSEIGERYIRRTLGEMAQLREFLEQLRGGAQQALKDIEHMAHKIHGSGAMFGFDAVSDCARELEVLAGTRPGGGELLPRLEAGIVKLEQQVQAAANAR